MDIEIYKKYIKGLDPYGLINRLYLDTTRYVKESNEKWVRITNASLLCEDYKKEAEYDKNEADWMRFRQEYLINYICKKYGEKYRCALLNLVIAIERTEREAIDRITARFSRSSGNIRALQEGINYCSSELNSMRERSELLFQDIIEKLTKEKDNG